NETNQQLRLVLLKNDVALPECDAHLCERGINTAVELFESFKWYNDSIVQLCWRLCVVVELCNTQSVSVGRHHTQLSRPRYVEESSTKMWASRVFGYRKQYPLNHPCETVGG